MDYVGLFALDDEPDVELLQLMRALVAPVADTRGGWSFVEVRTADGGALIHGLGSPGSLAFNNIRGDEIWTLIHRLCETGRQAMVLDDRFVVAHAEHVPLVTSDRRADLQVCDSARSLKAAHEAFWANPPGPSPLTEDSDRSFYRLDGTPVTGFGPGERAMLERWPSTPFDVIVTSASRSQLRFAALSMVGRLFGGFLERPVRPIPDGLTEAFEAWLSDAWQLWSTQDENWSSLDVEGLAAFDGTFYGDEPTATLNAFDLAGRMSEPTDPSDQLGMAVFSLSSAITGPVSNTWWRQRGRQLPTAPDYPEFRPFTELADTIVAELLEQDLREGATPADVDVQARHARCRQEHHRLVDLSRHLATVRFPPPPEPVDTTRIVADAVPDAMRPRSWR